MDQGKLKVGAEPRLRQGQSRTKVRIKVGHEQGQGMTSTDRSRDWAGSQMDQGKSNVRAEPGQDQSRIKRYRMRHSCFELSSYNFYCVLYTFSPLTLKTYVYMKMHPSLFGTFFYLTILFVETSLTHLILAHATRREERKEVCRQVAKSLIEMADDFEQYLLKETTSDSYQVGLLLLTLKDCSFWRVF